MRFHRVIILKAIILKMPRLRIRGASRDEMRFQRVIILLEAVSCLKAVAARGVMRPAILTLHAPRGVTGSAAMNCGPFQACFGCIRRGDEAKDDEAEADTFPVLDHDLPIKIYNPVTCLSKSTFPSLAHQDSHSHHLPVKMYIPVRAMGLSAREPRNQRSEMRGC